MLIVDAQVHIWAADTPERPWPAGGHARAHRRVLDAFGPKRMVWGTDLTGIPCTYRQAVTLFTEELPWLEGADLEWVMGRAICEWLGWP